jgi:RNA polymerase sigma-70 factor (ECF subfamily)
MMSRTPTRSDAELVAATANDPQSFGELYRRHEGAVLSFFVHWTHSTELAADLTAETFAAALGSIATYQAERGEPRPWLFGIAHHVLARSLDRGRVENEARRKLAMPRLIIDDAAIERIEEIASLNGSASHLLSELSPPIRDAISGRVVDEQNYRELAQALACSESVVRQRVRRGLAQMRARLEAKQ